MINRIAVRLALFFSAALLVFALVIGGVFTALFRANTLAVYREELQQRALRMANTLGVSLQAGSRQGGGYGAYVRMLCDIAGTDVWVVDENLNLIMATPHRAMNYADLPVNAGDVVRQVFNGQTIISEGFSELLDAPTLTVGAPIWSDGVVAGALLLHAPVEGTHDALAKGYEMLAVSIAAALVLSLVMSVSLSLAFTRPLMRMKASTLRLTEGDYTARTGVNQRDEIGALAASIDALSLRLDEASREHDRLEALRRDFIANVSHELRTPVTVLRGSLEALRDSVVTDPQQVDEYHQQMLAESRHLERLVNDLIDLSRLQNADFETRMEPVNLGDIVGDAARSARQMAREKEVAVTLRTEGPAQTVRGDEGRLRQMLLCVLNNAVKFSPAGGTVTVTLAGAEVSIHDDGPGIPPEDLPHIFDRFYRASAAQGLEGTGLGLAIARQIAQRHGVGITVESKLGKGSTFTLSFSAG